MSDWFKDWFNSPEYLQVYKHRDEDEAEQHIEFILSNVETYAGYRVLDMACGAGRHAILLAKKGLIVTALDLSENLLSLAKRTADDENLKIEFIHSDIRDFRTILNFDLIVNLFTSFGYFESDQENFSILKKAYDLALPGGYFVLDFFNSDYLTNNLSEFTEERIGDAIIYQYREIKNKRVDKKIVISKNGDLKSFQESVRMFTKYEIESELTKIGFDIYKTFGDFFGNKFEQFASPRLIIICRK